MMKGEMKMTKEDIMIASINSKDLHIVENIVPKRMIEMAKNYEDYIVAGIENDNIVGTMCLSVNDDAGYIEILDIFVVENKRRQGVATFMIANVVEDLNEQMDYF